MRNLHKTHLEIWQYHVLFSLKSTVFSLKLANLASVQKL